MSASHSSDASDDEQPVDASAESLLEEHMPRPELRRVSSSSSEESFEPDEAGVIRSRRLPKHSSPTPEAASRDASTIVKALQEDSEDLDQPLTPRDVNRMQDRKPSKSFMQASAASTMSKSRQNLTLREQEKLIDQVKKENFSLKLKIFFLEERLAKLAPDHIDLALRENIELKVDFQTCQQELKKHKRMCLDLNKVVESLQADLEAAQDSVAAAQNTSHTLHSERERELEKEVSRLKAELQRERSSTWSSQSSGRHPNAEDARAEISRLRDELDAERDEKERILSCQTTNMDLRSSSRASMVTPTNTFADTNPAQTNKRLEELRQDNASLLSQINAQVTMLSTRNAEKEALYAELEAVKAAHADLENEYQLLQRQTSSRTARSNSNSSQASHQKMNELEDELLAYRDRFSAISLEMERKEAEIEDLLQDGEARDQEHLDQLQKMQDEWVARMGDLKAERDELNDLLADREDEVKELVQKMEEFGQVVEAKDAEIDQLNEELDTLTEDLKKLGSRVYSLEEELADREAQIANMDGDLQQFEDSTTRHTHVASALKDKVITLKAQVSGLQKEQDTSARERTHLRDQIEQLATQSAAAEEHLRAEASARRAAEDGLQQAQEAARAKDRELSAAFDKVRQREADLAQLNEAIRTSQSQSTDRLALELEVDRLKRDLKRAEREADDAREQANEASMRLANLKSANKDLTQQLEASQSARLSLSERLDAANKNLHNAREDLSDQRHKSLADKDRPASVASKADPASREQLAERNSLLSTIYQLINKGFDSPSKKEIRPQANFGVFQDLLLSRVKRLLALKQDVEKQIGDAQRKWESKYTLLKNGQDSRLRQLDRIEGSLKTAQDAQRAWKARLVAKSSEMEAQKNTILELQAQISSLKGRIPAGDGADGSSGIQARLSAAHGSASTYQRRLAQTQAQLEEAEGKLEDARRKVGRAEEKWEFRLRELEARLKAAEEATKRAKQGGKERVRELTNHIDFLEQELHSSEQRGLKLDTLNNGKQRQASSVSSRA